MRDIIYDALEIATTGIFHDWQEKLHILSGDIDPIKELEFDDAMHKLANIMGDILEAQPKLDIASITMADGTVYNASELANKAGVFETLATLRGQIKEYHG
jgi:hypothetical protein